MSSASSSDWPLDRDLTQALACLLGSSALRQRLAADAPRVADELRLRRADRAAFLALSLDQVEAQAEALLRKRFHQISKLLPLAMERMGDDAWAHFRRYAEGHWPEGHRRHLEDALEFVRYLKAQEVGELSWRELHRLQFLLSERRVAVHVLWGFAVRGRRRPALQLLVRGGAGRVGEYLTYFSL